MSKDIASWTNINVKRRRWANEYTTPFPSGHFLLKLIIFCNYFGMNNLINNIRNSVGEPSPIDFSMNSLIDVQFRLTKILPPSFSINRPTINHLPVINSCKNIPFYYHHSDVTDNGTNTCVFISSLLLLYDCTLYMFATTRSSQISKSQTKPFIPQ